MIINLTRETDNENQQVLCRMGEVSTPKGARLEQTGLAREIHAPRKAAVESHVPKRRGEEVASPRSVLEVL
jgi:hypothetical protein